MLRVLFIDDEPMVLSAIRRSLRGSAALDVGFVTGAQAALERFDSEPYDVVVTDYSMPAIDGLQLLARLRDRRPETARFLLSAYVPGLSSHVDLLAHQVFTKPWDPHELRAALERIDAARAWLPDPTLRRWAGGIVRLPSPPSLLEALRAALGAEHAGVAEAAELIARDPAMTAKLLQLAGSAFTGTSRRTSSVRDAVTHIGLAVLRGAARAAAMFRAETSPSPATDPESARRRGISIGRVAQQMFPHEPELAAAAHSAGVLCGIGGLIRSAELPPQLAPHSERDAALGSYLLALWGLPPALVQAVREQNAPRPAEGRSFDLADALYLAGRIVDGATMDESWVESLGAMTRLEAGAASARRAL